MNILGKRGSLNDSKKNLLIIPKKITNKPFKYKQVERNFPTKQHDMKTENLELIFSEYLKTANTQYALLINGSWGCEKTYFWKYDLKQVAEKELIIDIWILQRVNHI
jgi:hypothetical protein